MVVETDARVKTMNEILMGIRLIKVGYCAPTVLLATKQSYPPSCRVDLL